MMTTRVLEAIAREDEVAAASKIGIVGLVLSLLLAAAHQVYFYYFVIDDVFISLQYARNLARGNGLVYNVGERVEGYSNFLWVVLLAPFQRLGFDLLDAAKVLGILFSLGTVVLAYALTTLVNREEENDRRNRTSSFLVALSPLLLASSSAYALWSVSGLETALFSFLLTTSALLYLRELRNRRAFPFSGITFALLAMTRPEGPLFFGITLLHRGWQHFRGSSEPLRRSLFWLLLFLAVFGSYFLWRYSYYGYPLPNTVYLKAGGAFVYHFARGLYYAYQFATSGTGLAILLLPLLLPNLNARTRYLLLLVGGYIAFIVLSGGDWMPLFRFFAPILPLVFILVQASLTHLLHAFESSQKHTGEAEPGKEPNRGNGLLGAQKSIGGFAEKITFLQHALSAILSPKAAVFLLALSLIGISLIGTAEAGLLNGLNRQHETWGPRDTWLRDNSSPGDTIATVDAGSIGYYNDLKVIDMVGLLDTHIAHLSPRFPGGIARGNAFGKWDVDYILGKKPRFILLHFIEPPTAGRPGKTNWVGTDELVQREEFWRLYEPVGDVAGLFKRKTP